MNSFQPFKAVANVAALSGIIFLAFLGVTEYVSAQASPQQRSAVVATTSVDQNIRKLCRDRWPADYTYQSICVKRQTADARSLGY